METEQALTGQRELQVCICSHLTCLLLRSWSDLVSTCFLSDPIKSGQLSVQVWTAARRCGEFSRSYHSKRRCSVPHVTMLFYHCVCTWFTPSCKLSIKSKHEVVCLLVKSVSLWQHGFTSLSAFKSYLPTFSSFLNTLFTLIPQTPLKKLLNFLSCWVWRKTHKPCETLFTKHV